MNENKTQNKTLNEYLEDDTETKDIEKITFGILKKLISKIK